MNNHKNKILIVDDKPSNLRFLSKILTEQGYKVQRAINGQLALNGAIDAPPDLILLDVMMPQMDGYEVCQRLKTIPETREIPIVFLSALNEAIDKVKAFEVGGVDYITKPFQVEEVLVRIEKQLTIQTLSKQLQEQNVRLQQEIEVRKQTEAVLWEKATQLRSQNIVLMELARNKALHQGDLKAALKEITEATAHTIGIERVSVWLYNETQTHLQCLDLFQQSPNQHSEGVKLAAVDYPNYFQALAKDQLITAHDAHTDSRTQEFSSSYLTPLDITSMLDAPIRLGGQTVGVLCNEQVGKKRYWTPEEQNFTRSIADLVSLVLEAQERKRAEAALVERVNLAELNADVGIALTQGKSLQDMLGRCASALFKHLDAACARIWSFNEPEGLLELQASVGMYTDINGAHSRVPVGQLKIGLIAQERQPHIDLGFSIADFGLEDSSKESGVSESNELFYNPKSKIQNPKWEEGMVAFAGYPLILENRLVGVMALFAHHQLTEATLQAMASIANGIALGIDRFWKEEELRKSEEREREKAKELELTLNELKRTQAKLIQTEKMSSLGRMIAGVAHEINNPVSFIYGNLTPAREYFQDLIRLVEIYQQTYPYPTAEIRHLVSEIDLDFVLEDWQQLMDSMQMGAERIQEIVRSLKIFSRLDESEIKPVDIHEAIDNTLVILQHRLRAEGDRPEIKVIKDYGQLPLITCYASQLNQVFMNLLTNAIDALETQPSPRVITICTSVVSSQWSVVSGSEQRTSDMVVIQIADNGPGISEALQEKIFDPFFTTKPVRSGTGLGLSTSYEIVVEKHQGKVNCVSALGKGTEFIVEIPVRHFSC